MSPAVLTPALIEGATAYLDDAGAVLHAKDVPANLEKVRVVRWQTCEPEIRMVAWSYVDARLSDQEAVDLAAEWLLECSGFGHEDLVGRDRDSLPAAEVI